MTDLSYTPDVATPTWDVFVSSLDLVELEGERMRAGDLKAERFGSRGHKRMLVEHDRQRAAFGNAITSTARPGYPPRHLNPYKVRVGQTWMPVGANAAKRPPMEVIVVGTVEATLYHEGRMESVRLGRFHGGKGGWERVLVCDLTPKDDFAEWQLQVAARVADAEHAVNGAVASFGGFSALQGSGGRSEAIGVLEDEREKAA